jgi:hypothetical protein
LGFFLYPGRFYRCGLCHKTCQIKANLKRHLLLRHAAPTVVSCEYCGKNFRNKIYLDSHVRLRTCLKDAVFDPS